MMKKVTLYIFNIASTWFLSCFVRVISRTNKMQSNEQVKQTQN